MIEKAKQLLITLGYNYADSDDAMLEFALGESEKEIKAACNINEITASLESAVVKNAAGIFLFMLKNSGQSAGFSSVPSAGIKTISMGDTSITYGGGNSDEERLELLILALRNNTEQILKNRRIAW